MRKVHLFGIDIDNLSISEAIQEVEKLIRSGRHSYIVTPNA